KFDDFETDRLYVEKEEIKVLAAGIPMEHRQALDIAYENIRKFHAGQLRTESTSETTSGVRCWREYRAIEHVGLYIPGGSAVLPSTFLMLGIPARIAGCDRISVCSPPAKNGRLNPYLAYCAELLDIDRIYLI